MTRRVGAQRRHILAELPGWVIAGMTDLLIATLVTYAAGSGGTAVAVAEFDRRDALVTVVAEPSPLPEPEALPEPVLEAELPELPEHAERAPWEHLWTTKRAAVEAVRAEHAELVRLAEEAAEEATSGYAGDLEAYWAEHGRPISLTDHLRSYGLEPELRPSQRAARRTYVTRSHAETKAAQRRARERSLANRTADRRAARTSR